MLYQLSYASPNHSKTAQSPGEHADTLPLPMLNGTGLKVSIPPSEEQTGPAS